MLHRYVCKAADSRISRKIRLEAIYLWEKSSKTNSTICRFMFSTHGFWHKILGVLAFLVVEQVSNNTRQQEQNVLLTNLLFQNNAGKMLTYQHVSHVQQNCWEQLRAHIHLQHCICSLGSLAKGPGSRLQAFSRSRGHWTNHDAAHSPGLMLASCCLPSWTLG